jgi:hypothetical protein
MITIKKLTTIEKLNLAILEFLESDNKYKNLIEILKEANFLLLNGDLYFDNLNTLNTENIDKARQEFEALKESIVNKSVSLDKLYDSVKTEEGEKENLKLEIKNIKNELLVLQNQANLFLIEGSLYRKAISVLVFLNNFIQIRRKAIHSILDKKTQTEETKFLNILPELMLKAYSSTFEELDIFDNGSYENEEIGKINTYLKLLVFNFTLTEEEEYLECTQEQIQRLRKIKRELLDIKISASEQFLSLSVLKIILSDKIEFFIHKIELRNIICQEEELDYDEKEKFSYLKGNYFNKLYVNAAETYFKKNTPYQNRPIKQKNGNILPNGINDFELTTTEDVWKWSRHLRKRLKDLSLPLDSALEEIDLVLKVIKKEIDEEEEGKTTFKSFSLRSAYNLLFNTSIKIYLKREALQNYSSCLDKKEDEINEIIFIRKVFNMIKDKQDDLRIYDYYPYQSLLLFFQDFTSYVREDVYCLGIDKANLTDKNELELTEKLEKKIVLIGELYFDAINLFQKNLKWCKTKRWNPIYLEEEATKIQDSFIDEKGNSVDFTLFVDSSYVLPDNFEKIEEKWYAEDQYRKVTLRSLKNRAQFEIHRFVTEASVEKKKEEFEKKVKDNEFKMVQIVAMFVTIATFVLANVKIFENKDLAASLSVMFGFGACMLLFNAFFKWLIQDNILIDFTNIREGKTGVGQGDSILRYFKLFTDYKYIFSDAILLGLIFIFGALSINFKYQSDKDIKHAIEYTKQTFQASYKDSLYIANKINDQKLQKNNIKMDSVNLVFDSYLKDSAKKGLFIEKKIKELVKTSSLK